MRTATQQRHQSILDLLAKYGQVQVEALSKEFAISEVTIRKDLAALEKNGLLLRRYAVGWRASTVQEQPPEVLCGPPLPAAWCRPPPHQ